MPTNVDPATVINALNSAIPAGSVQMRYVDDNLRALKDALVACFPGIGGAVTASHLELSFVDGVTSAIQVQIDAKGAVSGQVWTGAQNFSGATITVPTGALLAGGTPAASQQHVLDMLNVALSGGIASSSTSLVMALVTHNLVIETGKSFGGGMPARLFYDATHYMDGLIVSYVSATGALAFAAQSMTGTGTYGSVANPWSLTLPPRSLVSDASRSYFYTA